MSELGNIFRGEVDILDRGRGEWLSPEQLAQKHWGIENWDSLPEAIRATLVAAVKRTIPHVRAFFDEEGEILLTKKDGKFVVAYKLAMEDDLPFIEAEIRRNAGKTAGQARLYIKRFEHADEKDYLPEGATKEKYLEEEGLPEEAFKEESEEGE